MKYLKSSIAASFVVFGVLTYCNSFVSLANAAGSDRPDPSETTGSEMNLPAAPPCEHSTRAPASAQPSSANTANAAQHSPCSVTLQWRRWSEPFVRDGNHCRQLQGNLVCLTPESSQRLRW